MLKTMGAAVILLGAVGLAYQITACQKDHGDALLEMRNSLIRMKQQVVYIGISAAGVLEREIAYQKEPLMTFYRNLADLLEQKNQGSFHEAVEEAAHDREPFTPEEWELLKRAMESLFCLEQVKEEQAFDAYLEQLDERIRQEERERGEKRKVTWSVTILSAAMTLLLLW